MLSCKLREKCKFVIHNHYNGFHLVISTLKGVSYDMAIFVLIKLMPKCKSGKDPLFQYKHLFLHNRSLPRAVTRIKIFRRTR